MAQKSPLATLLRARGAKFVEEDGWIVPLHFGNARQEYEAVRSHVGLLDLCLRALLRFRGTERTSYLQGMVSNDVAALAPGTGAHAAVLDVNGKILSDLRIFCDDGSLLMDLWKSRKVTILEHLTRHLVAEDVEIDDLAARYGNISLQGPKAVPLLNKILQDGEIPSGMLDHRPALIGQAEVRLIRSTHTGEQGFDLFLQVEDLLEVVSRIEKAGHPLGLSWVGTEALDVLRLEAGIPRYGVDMNAGTLLLETGLDHAVSFDKGCYLGQEVVERIHSRGHVNKKLTGLVLQGITPAQRGDMIRAGGQQIGEITSSRFSPAFKRAIALGYLHRDYLAPGLEVAIQREGRELLAETSSLPFYKPPTPLETPSEAS